MDRERGATAAEYALVLAVLAVAVVFGADRMRAGATRELADRAQAGAPDLAEEVVTVPPTSSISPTSMADADVTTTTAPGAVTTSLSASTSARGSKWSMTVTMSVVDTNGQPVLGATVTTTWDPGGNGPTSCVTVSPGGSCSVTQDQMRVSDVPAATMTVSSVEGAAGSYVQNGATITAPKP